jgi:hypothetical protein
MPHVDELLGITTLASMGLFVAVSLQPLEVAEAIPATAAERPLAPVLPRAQRSDTAMPVAHTPIHASLNKPGAAGMPGAMPKERT